MTSPSALLRIIRRPINLLGPAFPIFLLASLATIGVDLPEGAWHAGSADLWPSEARIAFWRITFSVSGLLGFAVMTDAMDLLKGAYSWTLPQVHRKLVAGVTVIGLAISLPAGALPAWLGDPQSGVIAFLVAAAFFTAWTALPRLPLPLPVGLAVGLLMTGGMIGLWLRADPVVRALEAHPVRGALIAGAMLLAYGSTFTIGSTRRLVGALDMVEETGRSPGRSRLWTKSLARADTLDWIRAAHYELFGDFRLGFPGQVGFWIVMYWVMQTVFGVDGFLSIGVLLATVMTCQMFPLLLRRGSLYPVSRARRGTIAFWGSLATLVVAVASSVAWATVLAWTTHLVWTSLPPWSPKITPMVITALAWLPVVIFAETALGDHQFWSVKTRRRQNVTGPGGNTAMRFAGLGAWGALVFPTSLLVKRVPDGAKAAVAAAIIISAQLLVWLAFRRFYRRHDLV